MCKKISEALRPSIASALVLILLISGCAQTSSAESAISACENLCKSALATDKYLFNGPCLSDATPSWEPNWKIDDWACDVASSPRQAVDYMPENQCHGSFNHFVEVNSTCDLIRVS